MIVNESKQDLYFNAELHRLTAECHLALDEPEAAKTALGQAIEMARSRGALDVRVAGSNRIRASLH